MDFDFKLTEKRKELIQMLKLDSAFALVGYFPSRYDDFSPTPLDQSKHQQRVVLKGTLVAKSGLLRLGARMQRFSLEVMWQQDVYRVVVFNRPYLLTNLVVNEPVLVTGKLDYYKKEIMATDILVKDIENLLIRPRYRLPEGFHHYQMQRLVTMAYQFCIQHQQLDEIIPTIYRDKYRLWPRKKAYYSMHFPTTQEDVRQALRYLKYEELLLYSLMMKKMKSLHHALDQPKNKQIKADFMQRVYQHLPFSLTESQTNAIAEIQRDIVSQQVMYRLLQGDVGSGKTLVAMMALALNYSAGYQGAFMAPTEILAQQHFATLRQFFAFDPQIKIALLTSSLTTKEKKEVTNKMEAGQIHLLVGTHALIQESVKFANLGLAIIDEQHRFGVAQRKLLREKGEQVELLMMSATPIPRTLAISLFGDMDVSTLLGFPSSRRQVITKIVKEDKIEALYATIVAHAKQKEAVFVVCPLIEEGQQRKSVTEIYAALQKRLLNKDSIRILHGKMSHQEKEKTMEDFKNGVIQILVATTVIEVGIDIKHANLIAIFDANSFGLAQLHQLRGRVGRGGQQAFCYLVLENESEEALRRLSYLVDHEDGFDIARFDLANRGQGDIAGVRQSGVYDFQVASIYDDLKILEIAREDAQFILDHYTNSESKKIIDYVETIMAKSIAIID